MYVTFHKFVIFGNLDAALIYIESLSGKDLIDEYVLAPLIQVPSSVVQGDSIHTLVKKIPVSQQYEVTTIGEVIEQVSSGNTILLVDKARQGIALGLGQWAKRSIEEPMAEPVIRGARDGFTETLTVNTSLLVRRIKSPLLKMSSMKIGRYTQTQVVIAYMEGIADPSLIQEVMSRLQRIDIDAVLESGYIEELIEDNPFSPFPQFFTTERPDVTCAHILEGRVAIMVDSTPVTIIAPTTLFSLFQSPEDYYQRYMIGTMIRWLRYLFIGIALLAPSAYIAILTYHQEMIPTVLLLSIAKSREEIPFPALVEALLMEITFEALREAGIRLPKQVGAAVSIVGALVIGQAATAAGLVSAPMVMVVAITGIASFMIPHYTVGITIRMLRFPIMIMAGLLGLLGIILCIILIAAHLSTLRSFGVPYMTPLAPMKGREIKSVLFRAPWWMMNTRPSLSGVKNKYRQAPGQKPGPNKGDETK
jgi:spore germination protein KA